MKNFIAFWWIAFSVFFVLVFFTLRRLWLSCVFVVWCMAPLAPVVVTIRGAIVQPWFCMTLISGAYFVSFSITFLGRYLLLQYVNSMNWMVGVGCDGRGFIVWVV
jgi:hypothetical protein